MSKITEALDRINEVSIKTVSDIDDKKRMIVSEFFIELMRSSDKSLKKIGEDGVDVMRELDLLRYP